MRDEDDSATDEVLRDCLLDLEMFYLFISRSQPDVQTPNQEPKWPRREAGPRDLSPMLERWQFVASDRLKRQNFASLSVSSNVPLLETNKHLLCET